MVHRGPPDRRQRGSVLPDLRRARRGGGAFEGTWRRDRGRPGCQAGRPRHAALGLLPGSGWELDRDFVVHGWRPVGLAAGPTHRKVSFSARRLRRSQLAMTEERAARRNNQIAAAIKMQAAWED